MENESKQGIRLIIGLGNPGKEYENTYHNVGSLFINYLKKILVPSPYSLVLSPVFMNNSGLFVAKTLKKSGLRPENLLIVHDESDLELGRYKIQFGRGSAGHHGAESVINSLKTKNFWRLRVGIRPKEEKKREKAEKFVLKKISAHDKKVLTQTFEKIARELSV